MSQCLEDGFLGNLVKHQPLAGNLRFQQFYQVPADRFPLAVLVRGQQQFLSVFEFFAERRDLLGLARHNHIHGLEVLVDIHAQVSPLFVAVFFWQILLSLGQVADVPHAGLDRKVLSQVFGNRPGLGRRFDDHQGFAAFC